MILAVLSTKSILVCLYLAGQVLRRLAEELGYSSVRGFLGSHLTSLVQLWLDSGYAFTLFPYRLLDYNSLSDFIT